MAVLMLLLLIVFSNILNRWFPFIPVPLIQIGLGIAAALLPVGLDVPLDPELFLLLFIAPLLFNDGRRTPREDLWRLRGPILLLALGLVFATVFVAGYAIHIFIPAIPLAAAFALAAILSPTDAVAVGAMAKRVHLPESIHRVLEGESLMNDASGLVAFKFAIAAAVTSAFSLPKAALSFLVIAAGGLAAGAVLAFILIRFGVLLRRKGMEDVTVHTLLQLLTPFLIYLISEEIGVSGILAVVAGGIVHAIEKDRAVAPQYKLQLVSASTWSVLLYVLNGLVFLILGISIPDVIDVVYRDPAVSNGIVLGYIFGITALLLALRFAWIYLFSALGKLLGKKRASLKNVLLTSVSGVRGAVTLAGAFSIPLALSDGSPFPGRDLMLVIAAGVILLSLLIASVLLPLMAGKPVAATAEGGSSEEHARERMMAAGLERLGVTIRESGGDPAALREFAEKVAAVRNQADGGGEAGASAGYKKMLEAHLTGLHAERAELKSLRERQEITPETYSLLEGLLDNREAFLARSLDSQVKMSVQELGRFASALFRGRSGEKEPAAGARTGVDPVTAEAGEAVLRARLAMAEAAKAALEKRAAGSGSELYARVAGRYERMASRLREGSPAVLGDALKLDAKLKALQEQRDAAQQMYEDGTIDRKLASRLQAMVDRMEEAIWED